MKRFILFVCNYLFITTILGYEYEYKFKEALEYCGNNTSLDPADVQQLEFKLRHKKPIGVLTTSYGAPVDIRKTFTLNTNLYDNDFHSDLITHTRHERIPERIVHTKGAGALGYFEVTNDISKITSADVFNGIGKKTKVVVRFSPATQDRGGTDFDRGPRGMSIKFYTREGNLDLICLSFPVFFFKDPILFTNVLRVMKRNPSSNLFQERWDLISLKPELLHGWLWLESDHGIPRGYRHHDGFAIHTYEVTNKKGEKHYIRFNFRTEQGIENITTAEAQIMGGIDPDYFTRDLFNNIALKNYPSWKLEIDVLKDIKNIDFDPFDLTRLWRKGSYYTVPVGRLVLDRNTENSFSYMELTAYNPANLVPGIPGPVDQVFKERRVAYLDAQAYRLGINFNKIEINLPKYRKTYNRDGLPPVRENGRDAPNYYPNSFHGQIPIVDETQPKEKLVVYESNAVDLSEANYFYNHVLTDDGQRQRLVDNIVDDLLHIPHPVPERAIELLTLADIDLGHRVEVGLKAARYKIKATMSPVEQIVREAKEKYYKLKNHHEDEDYSYNQWSKN